MTPLEVECGAGYKLRVRSNRSLIRLVALVVLGAAAAVPLVPASSRATVLTAMAFDEQCRDAGRIFVGRVQTIESRRNPASPAYFETLVTFAVDESVTGATGTDVTLRFSGGTVDGARQSIDGMPEFAIGERYVVMADGSDRPPAVSPIVGFNQGLYRVESTPGGTRTFVRDRSGGPLMQTWSSAGTGIPDALRSDAATDTVELDAFLRAIRAARR